ncbi:carbohydrate-binding domain-containing protein [Amphibacillus indicireducens]|uniref:cellulase n=1 Tax=Amphibacillus indicireducens TaxID=1076330 RepID=A0ABP7W551_9BACI
MKNNLRRYLVFMLTFAFVVSVFTPVISAEDNEEGETNIVNPLPISEIPHESNYGSYPYLLDDGVRNAEEGGELSVKEVNGQLTLVDQNDNPIQLRGMSTHGLQWFGEIINENAFITLANDWDSNMIRLAMYVGEEGYATNPDVKDLVYEGIELAFENDMYVIVDWHVHAPGDPREPVYSGAYDFFEELADHYRDHPKKHYIIWELANEPSPNNSGGNGITNNEEGWQAVKEYAEPIVEMLREKGDNIILVGNPNWSQRPDLAADNPIKADNIMYSVHFYTGTHNGTNESYPEGTPSDARSNVMANVRYALDNGAAVFATEWGVSEANGDNGPYLNEADIWLNFLNENNISWANWSLTNKNETSGAFIPFILNESDATNLDPGEDQEWSLEELSVSGEYIRARIKGIEYEPIDRTPKEEFTEVIWDFNDDTTQGFGLNGDSPINVTLENENNALKISGLDPSHDIGGEGETYWDNARISSDNWNGELDILGATELTMDVIVHEPTTVAIAAIPQSEKYGWANPSHNSLVEIEDFTQQDDGLYKAVLSIDTAASPNLANLATDSEGSLLNNIILVVGTEDADVIYLDNITVSGDREAVPVPIEHDPQGEATFPSDFEDGTRQGWEWQGESGVRTALTIEEANGSNALSWEYAYPEVKPSDNWASAPRLDFWSDDLYRVDNEFVSFDFYIDPIEGRATEGEIEINLVFQPESAGYWAQSSDVFVIDLGKIAEQPLTDDGLYHYEVEIDITNINVSDDTFLRNMILIFADNESNFAGRAYVDNVKFDQSLEKRVEELERIISDLEEELAMIESANLEKITEFEDRIKALEIQLGEQADQSNYGELQQTVVELQNKLNTLKYEIRELEEYGDEKSKSDFEDNGHSTGEIKAPIKDDEKNVLTLKDKLNENKAGITSKGDVSSEKIDGQVLPITMTRMYNLIFLGTLLVITGALFLVYRGRKEGMK